MHQEEWAVDVDNILSPEVIERIKAAIDQDYIVVEHMHYAGGSSKDTLLFFDFDTFSEHVQNESRPGDLFYIYSLNELYEKNLYLIRAKYPDKDGRTPINGPY